jgi:putative DNA methylase
MRVRIALGLINQVLDEVLAEQESEYDQATRWAVAWFEQYGTGEGPYGDAETLSKAKDTAVDGLAQAGILEARGGKVRLFRHDELDSDWNPVSAVRLTVWEVTHQLIRALEQGGERRAADLLQKVGSLGEIARDLAYRLYTICERKKWAKDALGYNALVVSWPEITRLAGQKRDETQLGLGV